ncbi:MAG: hypothetical protein F6K17_03625 [Okeania sp. SIO3C4]|nr:hypothetical protein [Okeania sp. SIO3C4]
MKNLVRILVCLLLALVLLYPNSALAAKIPYCGKLPNVAVRDLRNIKAGLEQGRIYNNSGGHGGTKLPSIGREQEYREYDVDANNPNVGNRGKYRFVSLVYTHSGKQVYDPVYFTKDHYKTFCQVR